MNDQPKPIQVDHKGQPITSGIPVRNNTEYVAKAGVMILITHFIFHPLAVLYWCVVGFLGALWLAPGLVTIGIVAATHSQSTVAAVFAVLGVVLVIAGIIMWIRHTWRLTKRMVKGIAKHTKMRYVGNYRGPAAPATDWLESQKRRH